MTLKFSYTVPGVRKSDDGVAFLDTWHLFSSGLFPCGEGPGYAGGITSAAVDGINAALAWIRKFVE